MKDITEVSDSLVEATGECLLDDPEMRSLLSAAMTKINNERLKNNLAILLEDFAHGLTKDASLKYVGVFVSVTPSNDRK